MVDSPLVAAVNRKKRVADDIAANGKSQRLAILTGSSKVNPAKNSRIFDLLEGG